MKVSKAKHSLNLFLCRVSEKKVILIALIILGLSLAYIKNVSQGRCLASDANDSETFGYSLAVSGDYLAVGDPGANRVVLYQKNWLGRWTRSKVILPPKDSFAGQFNVGFGHSLAWRGKTLAIGTYDFDTLLRWREEERDSTFGSVHIIDFDDDDKTQLKEILVPKGNFIIGNDLSFRGEYLFLISNANNLERSTGSLLVIDIGENQIIQELSLTTDTASLPPKDVKEYNSLTGYNILIEVDDYGENSLATLVEKINRDTLQSQVVYLIDSDNSLQKIDLQKKVNGENKIGHLTSIVTTKNLIAIGHTSWFLGAYTMFLGNSESTEWSYVDSVNLSGPMDGRDQEFIISLGRVPPVPITPSPYSDHVLVQITEQGMNTISEIRHQSKFRGTQRNGVFDENNLILSAGGQVVQVPRSLLSKSHHIRNCI